MQNQPAQDRLAEAEREREAEAGAPKGLLQQMEDLMASLNADLSQLGADLQSNVDRPPTTAGGGVGGG
ncbi:hypothetical protein [Streptomyces sp. NPDC055287]